MGLDDGLLVKPVPRREINRLWNRYVARRVGQQGQPAPTFDFRPVGGGSTTPGSGHFTLAPSVRRQLKNPKQRYRGLNTAAHEMKHLYQDPTTVGAEMSLPYRQRPHEREANQFANRVVDRVKKDDRIRKVKRK